MSRLRTLVVMAIAAAVIVGAVYLIDARTGYTSVSLSGEASGPRPVVGGSIPDFTATTADGKPFSLSALKGKPVWLTIGATWCPDCRAEAPDLEATAARYRGQGLEVVGVFLQENAADVTDYARRVGWDFTFVPDPKATISSRYRVMGLPTHIFVGPDGVIRALRLGGLQPAEMDALARSILQ